MTMTTGYEKILALIDKKNEKVVSEVSPRITALNNSVNSETTLKPLGFRVAGLSVSGEQPTSPSLPDEDPDCLEEIIELALAGQLTKAVIVPVLSAYHNILGPSVWFCPDLTTAEGKTPDLAFTSEELKIIIRLLIENRELASTLVSAKSILGGTITDSSLLDLAATEPHDLQVGSDDCQAPEGDYPFDPAVCQSHDQNCSPDREIEDNRQSARELPAPGEHLVKIVNVHGYLHNFPEYTGPRACLEMEILEGPDAGKILVDNIGLSHPEESKGMLLRRLRIAKRLGLITRGPNGEIIQQGSWKLLEGVVCWVDVDYKNLGGRIIPTVDNYKLQ